MRTLRISMALALLAALLAQSIVALAAPREARAGGRAPIVTPQYLQASPRAEPVGEPVRYAPGYAFPKGKDPRHC